MQELPLVVGRLDYIGGRPDLPAPPAHHQRLRLDARRSLAAQGFNVTGWKGEAMQFWLVSDLNAGELRQFARQLRETAGEAGS